MVFSSYLFLFYFLPVALGAYFAVPVAARALVLTGVSYVFYGWANPAFALVMLISTMLDFACGLGIEQLRDPALSQRRPRLERLLVVASVLGNLSLLAFFKYFHFSVESYNAAVAALGWDAAQWDPLFRMALPLGISFYTFQSMSYTIDIYRGDARAVRDPVTFACYVSMFPQLVAGPIVRFREIAGQLLAREHTLEKFARGVALFSLGLAKKVLLANVCGRVADTCFDAGSLAALDAWYGLFAYAMQIYFDFSGYTDMAIGLGLMLGFVFSRNFDAPYRSASLADFWRRWHQSLSYFLRDYVYIPLGGNRLGHTRTGVNLLMVMLLGGLWHGAAWNFVAWGAFHGAGLLGEHNLARRGWATRWPRPVRVLLTFVVVSLGWVLFRAPDLHAAMDYYASLFRLAPLGEGRFLIGGLIYQPYYLLTFGAALVVTWGAPASVVFTERLTLLRAVWVLGVLLAAVSVMLTQAYSPFIYFTF